MKRKFLNNLGFPRVVSIDNDYFKGNVELIESNRMSKSELYNKDDFSDYSYLDNCLCARITEDNKNYIVHIFYDKDDNIISYYFNIYVESNVPYVDYYDLRLKVDINEEKFSVDGDELIRECYSLKEIEDKEINKAYNTLNKLIKEYINTDKIYEYNSIIDEALNLTKNLFYLEKPTINRKDDVIEFLKESEGNIFFKELKKSCNSKNYEEIFLSNDKVIFYMIREEDNKVVGIFNLMKKNNRYYINYSVKIKYEGYLKMLLYLSLLKINELNLNEIYIEGKTNNVITDNSIKLVGGILEFEEKKVRTYKINVKDSIDRYKKNYDSFIKQIDM